MPIKRPQFANGEVYHVIVRGVEQRNIFIEDSDYWRGIISLYEFNNSNFVKIRDRQRQRKEDKNEIDQFCFNGRDRLVEVLAFVFMPNHIHLVLRQIKFDGVSDFMRKFGAGYAAFFNKKYDRSGHLFQGRFRANIIAGDDYLRTLFVYIHTNPISLIEPGWKAKGIEKIGDAKSFLREYRWSSYLDYIGIKNFPAVTNRDFILRVFGDKGGVEVMLMSGSIIRKRDSYSNLAVIIIMHGTVPCSFSCSFLGFCIDRIFGIMIIYFWI